MEIESIAKLIALLIGLLAMSIVVGLMKKKVSPLELLMAIVLGFVLAYGFYNMFGEITGWWEPYTPQEFLKSIIERFPEFSLMAFLKSLASHIPVLSNLIG